MDLKEKLKGYKEELEKAKMLFYKIQGAIEATESQIEESEKKKK